MAVKTKTLGALIDELYAARAKRIMQQREVDEMKGAEKSLQAQIMEMLDKQNTLRATGNAATASITESEVPKVEDWKKFYAHVHKHKAFELLHKRIASTAWQEVHDAGKKVPGVSSITVRDLSITKAGGT